MTLVDDALDAPEPALGLAGVAAERTADDFLALPAGFDRPVLAQRSRVLAADGSLVAWLYSQNGVTVALAQVPQPRALLPARCSRAGRP